MAILVEGMEMPYNCWDCSLLNASSCPCKNYSSALEYTTNRHPNCPLIEVPEPHGNLIDADEIFVEFVIEGQRSKRYKLGEKWELNGEEIRSVISRLPTVIPASEECE